MKSKTKAPAPRKKPAPAKPQPRQARKAKKPPTVAERLQKVGIDAICGRIESGESQAEIAKALKVSAGELSRWLNLDENAERSARARETSAEAWLDKGLDAVRSSLKKKGAIDPTAAKAFAQECARRAALRNPRYVERTAHELSGPGGRPIGLEHAAKLPESLERALDALAGAAEAASAPAAVPN